MRNRFYFGWIYKGITKENEPEKWHAVLRTPEEVTRVFENPRDAIDFADEKIGERIHLEPTINSEMGYRVYVEQKPPRLILVKKENPNEYR